MNPSMPTGSRSDDPEPSPRDEGDECDDSTEPTDDDYEPL